MNEKQKPATPAAEPDIWTDEEDEQTDEASEKVIGKPTAPPPADPDSLAKAIREALTPISARETKGIPATPAPASTELDNIASRWRVDWETVGSGLMFLAVIGCVAWYFLHQHQVKVRKRLAVETNRQSVETKEQQTAASFTALVLKYNAVTNWEASLPKRGLSERPFTLDVSRALVRSDHQPLLLKCELKDVFEKGGQIFASLSSAGTGVDLSLELQCSPDQLKTFTGTNELSQFAVVARFDSVVRPKFKVSSSFGGEDSSIELDASSDVFLVKGELLDALRLP